MLDWNTWDRLSVCKNWIIGVPYQYLEPFNFVQMNE